MNDLIALPTVEQINFEHRLAFNKAGEAVQHATNCGLMLLQIKVSLHHGDWLPWLQGAIERGELAFGARQAQRYIRRASNTTSMSHLDAPTLQEALSIFSDQEPEEPHGTLIDVEAERKAREEAEAKAEAERKAREQSDALWKETVAYHQKLAESTQHELELERQCSAEWKAQWKAERDKKVEHSADYDALRASAAQLEAELTTVKAEQTRLIQSAIRAKLQGYQSEVDALERQRAQIEEVIAHKKAYLDSLDSDVKRIETHRRVIDGSRLELIGLAAFLNDLEPMTDPDTVRRWLALADMHEEAMKSIRGVFGTARPALSVIQGAAA